MTIIIGHRIASRLPALATGSAFILIVSVALTHRPEPAVGTPLTEVAPRTTDQPADEPFRAGASHEPATSAGGTGRAVVIIDRSGDGAGHELIKPTGVAIDSDGNVYVAGSSSHNAFKITPTGTITQIIDASGDGAGNILDNPRGIAVGPSGNVFVPGIRSDNVFRIFPDGTVTEIIDETGDGTHPLFSPLQVAVDGIGNAYVAGLGSHNVFKTSPDGSITQLIDEDGDGLHQLRQPGPVAADVDGNVYVSCSGSDNAFRITPAGDITQILDRSGDGTHQFDDASGVPGGVAVDANGNVYAAAAANENIFKITPEGTVVHILGPEGDGMGGELCFPRGGLATDLAGNGYVTGSSTINVFKISPEGEVNEIYSACDSESNFLNPIGYPNIVVDSNGALIVSSFHGNSVLQVGACGDGIVDPLFGEVCDDGGTDDCGPCNADCTDVGFGSICGDGVRCPETEDCDDDNLSDADDCSSTCSFNLTCFQARELTCDVSAVFDNSTQCNENFPNYSCDSRSIGGNDADSWVGARWYVFTAPQERVRIDTCASLGSYSILAAYQGSCGDLIETACGDNECEPHGALNMDGLTPGNEYYVQVASFHTLRGSYTVRLDCQPDCGDGILDESVGEQCDDGGRTGGDGCDEDCRFEGACCDRGGFCTDNVARDDCSELDVSTWFERTPCSEQQLCGEANCDAMDIGRDGDVDIHDFRTFRRCDLLPDCDTTDYNGDGAVDMLDFGMLQACFTGSKN